MKIKYALVKILFIVLFVLNCLSMPAQNPFMANWPLQNDGVALTSGAIAAQTVGTSNNFGFSNFTGTNFVTATWNANSTDKYIEFQVIPNANHSINISSLSYTTHFQSATTGVFSYVYYSYDNFATSHYLTFNNAPVTGSNGTYQSNFSISNLTLSSNQPISIRIIADSNATNPPPFEFVVSDFQISGSTISSCNTPIFITQPYPNNQVVCANGINSIAIISQAINVSHYQWMHNGFGLVGQNGPELYIFNISPSDSGTYTVFAINSCGEMVASNSVTVTVNPTTTLFYDNDGDGFGDAGISFESCTPVPNFVTNNLDCDDTIFSSTNSCNSIINLKVFIEGYMDPTHLGWMKSVKNNQDFVSNTNEVTHLTVDLRDVSNPNNIIATTTATLLTNGNAICSFSTAPSGTFYLTVKSNNTIRTWSANPVTVGSTPLTYDFSDAASKAYGMNMVQLETGIYGLHSGDLDDDGNISNSDYSIWENDANNFESGVFATDLDGDGNVSNSDYSILEKNSNDFISEIKPTQ